MAFDKAIKPKQDQDYSSGPKPDPETLNKPDHPALPRVRPDIDPDIPERPGPPLNDPENPHGKN